MELYALKELSSSDSDLQEVEIYYLEKLIQKGKGCTRLLQAQTADSDEPLAIKLFPKKSDGQVNKAYITEERVMASLSHQYLVKNCKSYKDALIKGKNEEFSQYSAIVTEYVSSQDLFSIVSNAPLSEKVARTIFKQIISVVEYIHGETLAYLDLKLENFLVNRDGIKLIELGECLSTQSKLRGESPQSSCGYRAPELVKGECEDGKAIDIYALGVLLFIMVAGTPPYTEYTENKEIKFDQYYEALRKDTGKFWKTHEHYRTSEGQEPFNKEFKQLIEAMLKENPQERIKMEEIKKSQWMKGDVCSKEELMRGLGLNH